MPDGGGKALKEHIKHIADKMCIRDRLKSAQAVKDKFIPLILGGAGIVLCAVWVLAGSPLTGGQEAATAVFTAVTQGILVAGLSTYVNQIVKQAGKKE